MFQIGTIFPLDEVLPKLRPNAPLILDGVRVPKTWTLRLIPTHGITCAICGKQAVFFMWQQTYETNGSLRLVFNHLTNRGSRAFMNVDHILPVGVGGTNEPSNLQLTCSVCNADKGSEIPFDAIKEVDWRNTLMYDAYITWYIKSFHKKLRMAGWNNIVKIICNELKKRSTSPLDLKAFYIASNQVHNRLFAKRSNRHAKK